MAAMSQVHEQPRGSPQLLVIKIGVATRSFPLTEKMMRVALVKLARRWQDDSKDDSSSQDNEMLQFANSIDAVIFKQADLRHQSSHALCQLREDIITTTAAT